VPEEKILKEAAPGPNAKDSPENPSRLHASYKSAPSTGDDRRSSLRHAISATAEIVEPRSRTRLTGRATDLSMGGCYVDLMSPLEAGTSLHLRLTSEGLVFQCEGQVLYSNPGMGMGVAFTKMPPEHLETLRRWMQLLSGDAPPLEAVGDAAFDFEAQTRPAEPANMRAIISELIILLVRQRVLTDAEAKEFQKKLSSIGG